MLTVLLALFVATTALTALLLAQQREVRMVSARLDQAQAYHYALGAEQAALAALDADFRRGRDLDHPGELWARMRSPFPVAEGEVSLRIEDAQGRLNLNSLAGERAEETARFERLLPALDLGDAALLPAILDRLDADDRPREKGAESGDYALEAPPYRSGNQPFADLSELLLVKGMTREFYERLRPWLAALPQEVFEINVNTAPDFLLEALLGKESLARLHEKMGARGFLTRQELNAAGFSAYGYSTQSDYFTLYVQARYRGASVSLTGTVARRDGRARTIARDFSPAWLQ